MQGPTSYKPDSYTPIMRPNEVKGFLGRSETRPDRIFYVLDVTSRWEFLWELDGYVIRSPQGDLWTIHLICPKCRNTLTIKSESKAMHVTEEGLEIDEFCCTWPAEFGGICTMHAALVLPRGGQRTQPTQQGIKRVDAVFKYA